MKLDKLQRDRLLFEFFHVIIIIIIIYISKALKL